jgi:hypothetical protein
MKRLIKLQQILLILEQIKKYAVLGCALRLYWF